MPIIPGDMGIKSFSYQILVVSDGNDSWEECEDCVIARGYDPSKAEDTVDGVTLYFHPVFADTEMDRNPTCDDCRRWSFCFSPTAECMNNWADMLRQYIVDRNPEVHNMDFLDEVAAEARWCNGWEAEQEAWIELYKEVRQYDVRSQ